MGYDLLKVAKPNTRPGSHSILISVVLESRPVVEPETDDKRH